METVGEDELCREIARWDGVALDRTAPAVVRIRYGDVELGRVLGGAVAQLPFPRGVRDALIALGHASAHPTRPASEWVARRFDDAEGLAVALRLFRVNYERAVDRAALLSRYAAAVGSRTPMAGTHEYMKEDQAA